MFSKYLVTWDSLECSKRRKAMILGASLLVLIVAFAAAAKAK
jgi:hypothetical protein